MKSFLKYTLATIVGMSIVGTISTFIMFIAIGAITAASENNNAPVKENSILYMSLNKEIVDRKSDSPFDGFNPITFKNESKLGLNSILRSIKKASTDENIDGIMMDLTYIPASMATVEEIRDAIIDFKESGKFVYTYSDIMTQNAYYLASASDKIYMGPEGTMEFKGLRSKTSFLKGTFKKLGIEPVIFRHGKYKSAIEPLTLDKMSDASKEQTTVFINSVWDHMVKEIAISRGLTPEAINKIADDFAIRRPSDAVKHGLIDAVKYRDEIEAEFLEMTKTEKLRLVNIAKYTNDPSIKKDSDKDKIAIVYAQGNIQYGKGDNTTIGSETISKALKKAREDSTVKAIVFRINSPGGSAMASDIIWREATLAQQTKPLIVSMGDLAASGGYYIACPADTIVASEVTITGSIGVFGVLLNTQELMNEKLGITFDGVKTNKFADLPDMTRPMSEAEKEIIQTSVENVYDTFISHVADGRSITKEAVDEVGQGRVWSGVNASNIGLVDVFGGLNKAIEIAEEMAKVEDYDIAEYPVKPDPMEEFIKQLTGEAKANIIKNELGPAYSVYKEINALKKMQGVQARMPYSIEVY